MASMIQTFLIEKAFEFTKDYLTDPENVQKWRASIKDKVYEAVEDTETSWDDDTAQAFFDFLGW